MAAPLHPAIASLVRYINNPHMVTLALDSEDVGGYLPPSVDIREMYEELAETLAKYLDGTEASVALRHLLDSMTAAGRADLRDLTPVDSDTL